jgi:hypothetical protein
MMAISCAKQADEFTISALPADASRVLYISSDFSNAALFSDTEARFGHPGLPPEIWSGYAAERLRLPGGIECVSVDLRSGHREYAIRRPMELDDEYRCRGTAFVVQRCFNECTTAVVRVQRSVPGQGSRGAFSASMLVDVCRGVLIISEANDLSEGIPFDAAWLRGNVGILASDSHPGCSSS